VDGREPVASSQDRRLVEQVLQVCAREAGGLRHQVLDVDALGERLAPRMEVQDVAPGRGVRCVEADLAIEAAGP
jgi:hypothetical protein